MQRDTKSNSTKYFKNIDIFGYPISMNYNEQSGGINDTISGMPKHQTYGGAFLTIIFFILGILIFIDIQFDYISTFYSNS
jgi:hypothetical protein